MPNSDREWLTVVVWVCASLIGAMACLKSSPPSERAPEPEPDPPLPAAEPAWAPEPSASDDTSTDLEAREPEPPAPALTLTGIPECDLYLALYQRCEEYLKPQIMAGVRRFHHAEQASLVYYAGTPEAATLPESCRSMLDQLQADCPEQHRRMPKDEGSD